MARAYQKKRPQFSGAFQSVPFQLSGNVYQDLWQAESSDGLRSMFRRGCDMPRNTVKLVLFSFGLLSAAFVAAPLARQPQSPISPALGPLVGKWKLNADKSQDAPASEVITITSQGDEFILEFDVKNDNGYNPKYSITTNMKGTTVKPIYADGSKADEQWRVTRQNSKKFDMELFTKFGGWKDEYEVSSEGAGMTMHRHTTPGGPIVGIPRAGRSVEKIFVFEKVK
jgi:hypothetical protein